MPLQPQPTRQPAKMRHLASISVWVAIGVTPWAVILAFAPLTTAQYAAILGIMVVLVAVSYALVQSVPQD